jgi:hypothetical protein
MKFEYENLDHLKDFFYNNQNLFKKHKNVSKGTKHKKNLDELKNIYKIQFPYGYCFPISQFVFYYLGHYESKYNLMLIKKMPIITKKTIFTTSHWFVKNNENNKIIDISKQQFDKILNIENFYNQSRKANFGFKWFFKNGKRYKHVVPCKQVIKLYEEYRKIEINEYLEFFYQCYLKEKNELTINC